MSWQWLNSPVVRWVGIGLVLVIGLIVGVDRVVAWKVHEITHPTRSLSGSLLDEQGQPLQEVHFTTMDGLTLTGWFIPPKNGATLILQHGYRANSAQMLPIGLMLARHGFGVLLFDFRAHGASDGDLVTLGLYEVQDTHAAVAFLQTQPTVDPQRIGLLGNSMGGATGVLATADNPAIAALAIEGVFAELKDEVGVGIQVQTGLPAQPLDALFIFVAEYQTHYRLSDIAPIKKIAAIHPRPVLIMQGGGDERVLVDSGQRLLAVAGEPKEYWFEPTAAHVAFYQSLPALYEQRAVSFFERHLVDIAP